MKIILNLGDLGEQEAEIEYDYSPGTPDVYYLRNGDPGYPGTPAEVNITSLKVFGVEIDPELLSDNAFDKICDKVCDVEETEDYYEYYVDKSEYDI